MSCQIGLILGTNWFALLWAMINKMHEIWQNDFFAQLNNYVLWKFLLLTKEIIFNFNYASVYIHKEGIFMYIFNNHMTYITKIEPVFGTITVFKRLFRSCYISEYYYFISYIQDRSIASSIRIFLCWYIAIKVTKTPYDLGLLKGRICFCHVYVQF